MIFGFSDFRIFLNFFLNFFLVFGFSDFFFDFRIFGLFPLHRYTLSQKFEEDPDGLYDWCWATSDDNEIYEGTRCRETGLRHGVGTCVQGDIVYVGEWRYGREHGRGALYSESRLVYVGEFADGKAQGTGIAITDGVYAGDVRENSRNGQGTYLARDTKYDGDWRDGARHGRGVFEDPSGSFDGDFQKDQRHGRGVLTLADLKYDGGFDQNTIHGILEPVLKKNFF